MASAVSHTTGLNLKSYLKNRYQKCFVNGSLSDSEFFYLWNSTGNYIRAIVIYSLYKQGYPTTDLLKNVLLCPS